MLLWYSSGFRSRLLLFLPLVYVAIVIVLRDSGTDVRTYEQVLRGLLHEGSSAWIPGWEPLFFLLAKLGLWVFGSEVEALRFIGGFYVLVLAFFLVRADNRELLIFHLHYLPLFAYSHGMNAVRAGLATAVFLLAWQSLRRGFKWSFFLLSLASFLFHYSSALAFVLSYGNEIRFKVWRNFLPLLLIFAVVFGLVFVYLDYFEAKLALYSSYEAPSPFSGLIRTGLVVLLWMFFVSGKIPLKVKIRSFLSLVLPAIILQILAFWSYAALRLVDLMLFLAPLVLVREYDMLGRSPPRLFRVGLVLVSFLGILFTYRNFLADYDGQVTGTETPFLPYRTLTNE
jgi:hypothetical protein